MGYCHIVTYSMPSRLYDSVGVLKELRNYEVNAWGCRQLINADGDRIQIFFTARGNETNFVLSTRKSNDAGIFDLYVNGILDSAGYDEYAAAGTETFRNIVLTQPVRQDYNVFEFRVNGKNALSTGFYVAIFYASIY